MGVAKIGGVFGMLRKRVGSVVYSIGKDGNGKSQQVVRAIPTSVTNPQTIGQLTQRMKLAPAQKFYNAFESLVANGLLSHSFEGVDYGTPSRQHFMSLAMSAQNGPYVPKGVNRFIPAAYPMSRGSLPGLNVDVTLGTPDSPEATDITNGVTLTEAMVLAMDASGLSENAQGTIVCVSVSDDGVYTPHVIRFLNKVGEVVPSTADAGFSFLFVVRDGALVGVTIDGVAGCVIVSRQDAGGAWLRSNTDLEINDALKLNLYSTEAYQAALDSYKDDTESNGYTSAWYLNLANSQSFPGRLSYYQFIVDANGNSQEFIAGTTENEAGGVDTTIFTADGQAASPAIKSNGQAGSVTAAAIMQYNVPRNGSISVAKWNTAYLTQLGF